VGVASSHDLFVYPPDQSLSAGSEFIRRIGVYPPDRTLNEEKGINKCII
jgi:hypothetical protein